MIAHVEPLSDLGEKMELNKPSKNANKVTNPEGSTVLARTPEIQMYLEMSNLKIKGDAFYQSAPEKLASALALAKSADSDFILGLAKFLADKGLKLSPVVLASVLSDKGFSFREANINYIFNTPQRIAEAIALRNMKLLKLNNSFKKHVLKAALENMNEFTLRKNKMKRRKIKLADLIKLLRAKPKDEAMAKLYKAIIENTAEASLKKDESIVSIKSSTELNEEQKKELIDTNLEKMPLNQIIRNLKFIADKYDFKKNVELQQRIIDKLNNVKDYRILNIFDVIVAAMYVPQFEKALFEVVKRFIEKTEEEFEYPENATILFDISGSMSNSDEKNSGERLGFLYLVLFSLLIKNPELYTFSDSLQKPSLSKIISKLKSGCISEAWDMFDSHFKNHSGGTALIGSATELLEMKEISSLIVISDEVSWKEGEDLSSNISSLAEKIKGLKLILINPVVYTGTVFKNNIVAVSSLSASILTDMAILTDEKGFIEYIKNYKKAGLICPSVTVTDAPVIVSPVIAAPKKLIIPPKSKTRAKVSKSFKKKKARAKATTPKYRRTGNRKRKKRR